MKNSRTNRLIAYLRLTRIHSSVLTGLAPVCTALAMQEPLPLIHYLALFTIGILFHIYLFVCNEICDIPIDKDSKHLKKKPLVEETLSKIEAKRVVLISIIGIILGTIMVFPEQAIYLLPITLTALLFGGLYDRYGKSIPHADYFIAFMIFFVALYGAYTVNNTPTTLSLSIAFLAFIQLLINNILAGIKDIDHDYLQGGKSTPLRLGIHIKDHILHVSKIFIFYILSLKTIQIIGIFLPFFSILIVFENWQLLFVSIVGVITVLLMIRLILLSSFKREYIIRLIGFHEMVIFMAIPVILFSYIGIIGMIVLLVLPVIWLGIFLKLMYGRLMPNI